MDTTTTGAVLSLHERAGLSAGPDLVAEALRSQRRRFVEFLAALPSSDWTKPTRCSAWSIHDVTRHMIDSAEIHHTLLVAGRDQRFDPDRFNPNKSPNRWLEDRPRQSPTESLAALGAAVDAECEAFATRRLSGGPERLIGPTRRPTHWTVFAMHILWDAWIHERDVVVPLGAKHRSTAAEVRLVCLYGLMIASAPAAVRNQSLRTVVSLEGAPDMAYEVLAAPDEIVVRTAFSDSVDLRGRFDAVLDSLAGRGIAVDAALSGCEAHVRYLAGLRRVLRAGLPEEAGTARKEGSFGSTTELPG
jgi:uncharacterized protein (TIGR03083 family)